MGIVNVTPDSFSDGGEHFGTDLAVAASLRMENEGAAIIDIGGESTRPGAEPVPEDLELERVIPVIERLRARSDVAISIDTMKASVAAAAIAAGADLVNDVTAMRFDPAMRPLVAASGIPVILMHMRGEPRTMQKTFHYDDLMVEITSELTAWRAEALAAGVSAENILIDPGIGFGKSFENNLEILARTAELCVIAPVVIGASRKAFVGHLTGRPRGKERVPGSLAAVAAAHAAGAAIVRVHDVAETADFLKVARAIGEFAR